jgi:hypothetical protein
MPRGLNRSGDFRNGTPITLPHEFGNPITEPKNFGNVVDWTPDPAHFGNPVTWTPDPAHFGNPVGVQATPTFSPVGGAYGPTQSVTITSAGATAIYYTLDGSTPTTSSTLYTGAISVSTSETIKAIAVSASLDQSAVGSATYTINGAQATPTFSPVAGSYSSAQDVTITSAGADTIYYTTDGSTPDTGSTVYSGPVNVPSSLELQALAVKADWSDSDIGIADYTISIPATTPTFVQSKMAFDGSSASHDSTISFDNPITDGNSIFVYVTFAAGKASSGVPTDNQLNTYTLVSGPDTYVASGGVSTYVYTCQTAFGPITAITVHGNANANIATPFIIAVETTAGGFATGVDDSNYAAVSFTSGASDVDGGAVVSTVDDDLLLLFASYYDGNGAHVFSAGTGWTLTSQLGDSGFVGGRAAFEQQTAGTAGSYEAFIKCVTNSGNGGMTTLALKTATA